MAYMGMPCLQYGILGIEEVHSRSADATSLAALKSPHFSSLVPLQKMSPLQCSPMTIALMTFSHMRMCVCVCVVFSAVRNLGNK